MGNMFAFQLFNRAR